jgi:anti-anti-sigma regulatory factor
MGISMSDNESGFDKKQVHEIVFDEILDITMVLQYHEKLNQCLKDKKQIILNAEKIERIDGAGLQLIVAFIMEAKKLNLQIAWAGISEVFKRNADILGVSDKLAL